MMTIREFPPQDFEKLTPYLLQPLYRGFSGTEPALLQADRHVFVVEGGTAVARASLWWRQAPAMAGEIPGIIGHFAGLSAGAASLLLDHCCRILKQQGCTAAVGPMDGNTWNRYRLVTWPGSEPPFFLEPENPPEYPGYFEASGFQPRWQYFSALETGISGEDPRLEAIEDRLQRSGIHIRPFRSQDFEAEPRRIYRVSETAFSQNLFYAPIPEAQFLAQYQPFQGRILEDLVLIAESHGEPLGFVFAFPDLAQQLRGQAVDTVVLKSLAILPGRKTAGLGALLTDRIRKQTVSMGFDRIIYALMHESNYSKTIANRNHGQRLRTYSLYAKDLTP